MDSTVVVIARLLGLRTSTGFHVDQRSGESSDDAVFAKESSHLCLLFGGRWTHHYRCATRGCYTSLANDLRVGMKRVNKYPLAFRMLRWREEDMSVSRRRAYQLGIRRTALNHWHGQQEAGHDGTPSSRCEGCVRCPPLHYALITGFNCAIPDPCFCA